jgi:hypothetical protein
LFFSGIAFVAAQTFVDVPTGYWAYDEIDAIYRVGITVGCIQNSTGIYYCPEQLVTRAQMAVYLIRAKNVSTQEPANATFVDVPKTYWAWKWIEALYKINVTTGCLRNATGIYYCPEQIVTRAQMAVFISRGINLAPYNNTVPSFSDVPKTYWAYPWIEGLYRAGIVKGYGDGTYRPEQTISRGQMAVFIARAFNLCVRRKPGISITPSVQQASAGVALQYSIQVNNNDTACGPTNFSFSISPSNWSTTLQPSAIVPNGSSSLSFYITSPRNAFNSNNSFTLTARNLGSGYSASSNFSYVIQNCVPLYLSGDPLTKTNIIFIGDGYSQTTEGIDAFRRDALNHSGLESSYYGIFKYEPFKSNKDKFNVYMINTSQFFDCLNLSSGDFPPACRNEILEPHISVQCGSFGGLEFRDLGGNQRVYLVNATGGGIAVLPIGVAVVSKYHPQATTHEIGHAFSYLHDEYVPSPDSSDTSFTSTSFNCDVVNISTGTACTKWCSGGIDTGGACYQKYLNYLDCLTAHNPGYCWSQENADASAYYCNLGLNCMPGTFCSWGCGTSNTFRPSSGVTDDSCCVMGGNCKSGAAQTQFDPVCFAQVQRTIDYSSSKTVARALELSIVKTGTLFTIVGSRVVDKYYAPSKKGEYALTVSTPSGAYKTFFNTTMTIQTDTLSKRGALVSGSVLLKDYGIARVVIPYKSVLSTARISRA